MPFLYSCDRVGQMKTMGSRHAKRVDVLFDEVYVELRKLLVDCSTKEVQFLEVVWSPRRLPHHSQTQIIFHSPSLMLEERRRRCEETKLHTLSMEE
jgi:hypothetical protein